MPFGKQGHWEAWATQKAETPQARITEGRVRMLTIATLREPNGRWTAEIVELPEILAYGDSREEAVAKVEALTLRLFADRLEHGHDVPEVRCLFAA